MQCQYCGQQLKDGENFCPSCGQTQHPVAPPSPYDPQNVNRPQAPGRPAQPYGYQQAGQPWQGGTFAPPPGNYSRLPGSQGAEVMTTGQFMISILLSGIPLLGFILLLVWAFSKNTNPNKRNWARAQLLFVLIAFILVIVFYGSLAAKMFH